jgi:hypothetical protein
MIIVWTFNLFGMNYNLHKTMYNIALKAAHLHGESKILMLNQKACRLINRGTKKFSALLSVD